MTRPDTFATITDLETIEDVVIRFWLLADGSVYEEREQRSSTRVILARHHHPNSEVAWHVQGAA